MLRITFFLNFISVYPYKKTCFSSTGTTAEFFFVVQNYYSSPCSRMWGSNEWNPVFHFSSCEVIAEFLMASIVFHWCCAILNGSQKRLDTAAKTVNDILNSQSALNPLELRLPSIALGISSAFAESCYQQPKCVTSCDAQRELRRWHDSGNWKLIPRRADTLLKHCQRQAINWREKETKLRTTALPRSSNKLTLGNGFVSCSSSLRLYECVYLLRLTHVQNARPSYPASGGSSRITFADHNLFSSSAAAIILLCAALRLPVFCHQLSMVEIDETSSGELWRIPKARP